MKAINDFVKWIVCMESDFASLCWLFVAWTGGAALIAFVIAWCLGLYQ
jgi:hypothetical protein